jgi:tetratricopeptide (TPR) repeat protein
MASSAEILQRAVQEARAGRKAEARDLLLDLVEVDPQNEMAWMWLSGLVDNLEDQIIACENVLTINPANEKVRAYLAELQRQQTSYLAKKNRDDAAALLDQAKAQVERKDIGTALQLATQAVEKQEDYEEAWLLLGKISPSLDQRIAALKKAYKLNPSNAETISALKQAQRWKANPLEAAAHLEHSGKFQEALELYKELAASAKSSADFDYAYKQITRIEGLQHEKIRYVAPTSSIARLTFGWPLLYFSLALIQMGLNPLAHPTPAFFSCMGLPIVILGSFLLSLSEIPFGHGVWQKLFSEEGGGSPFARALAAVAGWLLVLIPHILLILDSLNRLHNFKIPPMPL